MWAFSDSKTLDMWIPGAIFVGLGESITYYANFHVVNLLTKYRTLVVSLISGIWNAGGLNMCIVQVKYIYITHCLELSVFLFFFFIPQFIYFKFGVPRRTSLMVSASIVITMFLITTIFLCMPFMLFFLTTNAHLFQLFEGPIRGYLPGDKPKIRPVWVTIREYLNEKKEEKAKKINIELAGSSVVTSAEEKENEGEKVSEADDDNEKEAEEEEEEVVDGEENPHPFKYFLKHVFTKHFLAVLLYSIFCGYSISYGLGTIEYQYYDLTTKHEFYDQLFSIVASLGLVIIPLWSWMIDKIGLYAFGISLMVMDMFFYGALMIPSMPVYVVNFFIFSFIRVTVGVGVSNYNRMFFDVSLFGSFTGFVWFVKTSNNLHMCLIHHSLNNDSFIFYFTFFHL